jgi:hypothetical protein
VTAKAKFGALHDFSDVDEQIAWLKQAQGSIPIGLPLRALLSDELVGWFVGNAKAEDSCDIMSALGYAHKERSIVAGQLAEASRIHGIDIADLKKLLQAVQDEMRRKSAEYERTVADYLAQRKGDYEQFDNTMDELCKWRERYNAASEALTDAQIDIVRLKATLLDLLVKNGTVKL